MLVELDYASFVGVNIGRWILYETDLSGSVVRCVNSIDQPGRVPPTVVFQFNPVVSESEFLVKCPEGRKVKKIMADINLSNPNIITTPTPNATAFAVAVTTITTAGTPQQLASLAVPDGRALVVASNAANDPKKLVYVATSSANALLPASRINLSPGNSVKLYVDNADKVWVDTNQSGQKVDVIVEQ